MKLIKSRAISRGSWLEISDVSVSEIRNQQETGDIQSEPGVENYSILEEFRLLGCGGE
jgi:hypothetical protein